MEAAGERTWSLQNSGVSGIKCGAVDSGWVPELLSGACASRRQEESHEQHDHVARSRVRLPLLKAKDFV